MAWTRSALELVEHVTRDFFSRGFSTERKPLDSTVLESRAPGSDRMSEKGKVDLYGTISNLELKSGLRIFNTFPKPNHLC